jgi:hypothetical protein
MGFPITLSPSTPTGLDSPRLGDDELRNLKQTLADLFGLPVAPSTISTAIGSTSTGGKLTITNGVWNGDVVGLAYGGTNANLTASNGGVLYSTASALALLAGTATAGQILRSGASAAPSWSTATYPATAGTSGNILTSDGTNWASTTPAPVTHAMLSTTHTDSTAAAVVRGDLMVGIGVTPTWQRLAKGTQGTILQAGANEPGYTTATYPTTTTINQLLYSSAANTITGLTTSNNGVLVTSGAGVPSIGADLPTAVTIGGAYVYRASGTDVAVADGGTGLSAIADAAILATNASNVLTAVVAGAGQSIRRNAGNTAWEAFTPGAGAGTVTSVGQSFTGGLISVAGSPITTSGTLALTVAGTSGGIPYFSSASAWASSGALTANALMLGGGAGAAPTVLGSLGTTTTLLHGNAAGAPTFSEVSLTADVSGILPTANGGTGIAYFTAAGPTTARVYTFPDQSGSVPLLGTANIFTANQTISNTAPSLTLTDTTASAKSLTVAVDANLAQLRESAGASGSLLTLDLANNRVGVKTSSPIGILSIHAATDLNLNTILYGGTELALAAHNDAANAYVPLRIESSAITINQGSGGKVGIGMAPTVHFELSGSVGQKASGTTWSNPSDARLKENIRDYTDGLDVIRKIRPVHYELNGLAGTPKGQVGISVIAQEMLNVMPYTIETYQAKLHPDDADETALYRFEASAVTFALVNAVKELAVKVEALEAKP